MPIGDWMQTFTGRKFYPLDPHVDDIDPIDIAHSLSLLCRYNGHAERFYSVAEHCVLLSYAVAPEDAAWALMHDAAETYVGDMTRPLKRSMTAYKAVEVGILVAIAQRFNLPEDIPGAVKDADTRILVNERAALMRRTEHVWSVDGLPPLELSWPIRGLEPWKAERAFTERFTQLLS